MSSVHPELGTHFNPHDCTLDTCPIQYANFTYVPTLIGNVLYAALFAVLLVAQLVLGIRYKTWGFLVGMTGGLVLEIVGYAGRIQLHYNPFPFDPFVEQLICLTLGPAFLSASIYLCLARIVMVYGPEISRVKPRVYSYIFVSCDFISLVLQGTGGGIAAVAKSDVDKMWKGVHIMMAGLAWQVVSLALFMVICTEYSFRVRRFFELRDPKFETLRKSGRFTGLLFALASATILIFIRCAYRVAELQGGFKGHLANDQVTFMIFEGPMIIAAVLILTVFHPSVCFKGRWAEAAPSTGITKNPSDGQVAQKHQGALSKEKEPQQGGNAQQISQTKSEAGSTVDEEQGNFI